MLVPASDAAAPFAAVTVAFATGAPDMVATWSSKVYSNHSCNIWIGRRIRLAATAVGGV